MTLDDVQQQYQIAPEIIDIWAERESDTLLPIQEIAIREHQLLEGRDLLVSAPTSSGKTFLAEIAALHTIFQRKKVIYLLPLKALAEEKYADFSEKYADFGLDVVISTGDRNEFDSALERGEFQLAVIVFEKANRLLVRNKHIINNCGVIIIDEIQMTADFSRGSSLELLLTTILHIFRETAHIPGQDRPQFIALSAVIGAVNKLDEWLGVEMLRSALRPVELREGILRRDGAFTYRSVIAQTVGSEQFPPFPAHLSFNLNSRDGRREYEYRRVQHVVSSLLSQGEQVLIFMKWKSLTRDTALRLAQDLQLPPATEAIEVMHGMEDSISKEMLIESLRHGVAFHNADLGRDERRAIESAFQREPSKIRVICATSTLAMGMNLPVNTVIINDLEKPDPYASVFQEVPLSSAEYKNMSGRAGRLKRRDEGRSIIFAENPAEERILWRNYIEGEFPHLDSLLAGSSLTQETLFLIAAGICESAEDLAEFMLRSYAGTLYWQDDPQATDNMRATLQAAIELCLEHDLIAQTTRNTLQATEIGRICASQGVSSESFITLTRLLEPVEFATCDVWELLFILTHNRELEDLHFRLSQAAFESGEYWRVLEELDPPHREELLRASEALFQSRFEVTRRIKMALLLFDWMTGMSVQALEFKYNQFYRDKSYSGVIRGLTENAGWMMRLLADMAAIRHEEQRTVFRLQQLADRLLYGVSEAGIELAALRVPGLTRMMIMQLAEAGYSREEHVLDAELEDLARILPREIAFRLQDRLYRRYSRSETRHLTDQRLRLEHLGYGTTLLKQVYSAATLEDFAGALQQLFQHPQVKVALHDVIASDQAAEATLGYERDYTLDQEGGTLFVRILPPNTRDLSEAYVGQLLAAGMKYRPAAFLLIGRPDFTEATYAKARDFSSAYSTRLLLYPAYEICERYVRALEERTETAVFEL